MGKSSFKDNVKELLYPVAENVFLWCVGYKSIEGYINALIDVEVALGTVKRIYSDSN